MIMNSSHVKSIKRTILRLFLMVMIVMSVPVEASAQKSKELVVGYIDYHGFIDKSADGNYTGYGVDYLNRIADYTGYTYSYQYGNWEDNLEKLKNGEIDLICTAQHTPNRDKEFEFSRSSIGSTQGLLYACNGSDIVYEDFKSFDGMKIALLKENAMNELFQDYAKKNGFTYRKVFYDDTQSCVDALNRHEVDAVVSESLLYNNQLKLIANFGADPFYIISYIGNEYMEDINYALREIKRDGEFENNLFKKYYGTSVVATTAEYTKDEKAYIKAAPVIKVAGFGDSAPMFWQEKKSGEIKGIYVDVFEKISSISGLKFEFVTINGERPEDVIKEKKCDVFVGIDQVNYEGSKEIMTSDVMLSTDIVAVVDSENKNIDIYKDKVKVAVLGEYINLKNYLEAHYPNLELVEYNTNLECMEALRKQEVEAFIQNSMIITNLLYSPKYGELEILPVGIMQVESVAIADKSQKSKLLLDIIDKAYYTMGDSEVQSIAVNIKDKMQHIYSVQELWYKYKFEVIAAILIFVGIVCTLVCIIHMRRLNEMQLKEANQQLKEAIKRAEYANSAKSDFLSRMSHDIRTPMNSIIGTTTLAYEEIDNPQAMKIYLDNISNSGKFLMELINDVLDMSKIEKGQLKLHEGEFYTDELIENVRGFIEPIVGEKNIEFICEAPQKNVLIKVDKLRINQIFLNILSNAVKFTPKGGRIELHLEDQIYTENRFSCEYVFKDTGIGMSEEYLSHVFEPFTQEKNELTNIRQGSGLGLAIVKSLVDVMNGEIAIESELNVGTTIRIKLEFEIADIKETQYIDKTALCMDKKLEGRHILLVEDHDMNSEIAKRILEKKGMVVTVAKNGVEAIQKFVETKEGEIDAILMDIRMPLMDGLEATQRIRDMERSDAKAIPIIAMTADAFLEDMQVARDAGMDEHLPKPIQTKELYATLARVIR